MHPDKLKKESITMIMMIEAEDMDTDTKAKSITEIEKIKMP